MTRSSMEIFLINFPIKRDAREYEKAYEERAAKKKVEYIKKHSGKYYCI